ncbi:MAG: FAD-dependent oxidoreductase [Synergistaceae bacterium]|nr:FAD-dependent oxidoreductase [Synergistaceae bacterium]
MNVTILGAGLAGITLAYFLQENKNIDSITLLEKEKTSGGLCRSLRVGSYTYDIGPHILFSKDKEMLNLMLSVLNEKNDLRRSNQIIFKKRWIQYPFENDLSKLPAKDLQYCIQAFNHNPYENYEASNMLQFFLKTFGEGITNSYLRPYNEKIWKYDPSYMNTSMVDRIPKPTPDEIRRSASGETVDGYVHQLYFSYPSQGGIEAVVRGFEKKLNSKCKIETDKEVTRVEKLSEGFSITTSDGVMQKTNLVISTIPVQELTAAYSASTGEIRSKVQDLRYNSIMIAFVKTKYDLCGENFAFMIPDKNVIFHRISKMDFLGDAYKSDGATYMVEVTYRKHDSADSMSEDAMKRVITEGVCEIGFAKEMQDVEVLALTRHQYAYVIYDINHTAHMTKIRDFYRQQGIVLHGRFGNFEYWNMDRILRESFELAERLSRN